MPPFGDRGQTAEARFGERAERFPNIAARRLHLFVGMRPGPNIAPLAEQMIAAHWPDIIRLATSIRISVTSASAMLERLGS